MLVNLVLRFYDLFACLFRLFKVDYEQLRAILEAKLRMDGRRQHVAGRGRSRAEPKNTFTLTMMIYASVGAFLAVVCLRVESPLVAMTFVHAAVIMMVAMSLISDFSSVLLDTSDGAVLGPRPVGGRTLLVARIVHVVTYLGLLALSLSVVTLVVGTVRYHVLFPLVFAATLAGSLSLVICIVNLFYVAAFRLSDSERFRDIVLYMQIAMSIFFFGGYQLLPRLMDPARLHGLHIEDQWWIYLCPPTWMAAPIDLLTGHVGRPQIVLTILALGVPIAGLMFVVSHLGPRFSAALARLDAPSNAAAPRESASSDRRPLCGRIAAVVTRNATEAAAFEFVWTLCSRDRQFKLRTYPSIAMLLVVAVIMLPRGESIAETLSHLPSTKSYILLLYFACMFVPMASAVIRFSDRYEAAWIYYTTPLDRPGDVLSATLKVLLVRFAIPLFLLLALVVLAIWGPRVLPDVVLASCGLLAASALQAMLAGRRFPFTEEFKPSENSGRLVRSLLHIIFPVVLGGLHYFLTFVPFGVPLAIPVMIGLLSIPWRLYAGTSWAALQKT